MSDTVIITGIHEDAMHIRLVELERELAQYRKDWDAMLVLIAQSVGTDEEREWADEGGDFFAEYDPWASLRATGAIRLANTALAASVENLTADLRKAESRIAEWQRKWGEANDAGFDFLKQRDHWKEQAEAHRSNAAILFAERDAAIRERDEAIAALDELMAKVPVGSFAGPSVALVELMRKRYAREAEQWKANHEQRKQERDEARKECERLCGELQAVKDERNGLHTELKAVVDVALDEAGMPISAMLGSDAPSRVMRKLIADRSLLASNLAACQEDLAKYKALIAKWRTGLEHLQRGFPKQQPHTHADAINGYCQGVAMAMLGCEEHKALSPPEAKEDGNGE